MTTKELIRIMNHNLDMLRFDINSQMDAMRKVMEEAWLGKVHADPKKGIKKEPSKIRPWTDAEKNRLIKEINSGKTYSQLMTLFPGRTQASLQTVACDLRTAGKIRIKRIRVS